MAAGKLLLTALLLIVYDVIRGIIRTDGYLIEEPAALLWFIAYCGGGICLFLTCLVWAERIVRGVLGILSAKGSLSEFRLFAVCALCGALIVVLGEGLIWNLGASGRLFFETIAKHNNQSPAQFCLALRDPGSH